MDKMAAAEALISTIARAFYDDDVVCLIDVLLREHIYEMMTCMSD